MSATTARSNDAFDDDDEGLSGFTILAILATLIVVFVLVVMYAYRQGVASGSTLASEELPVVAADPRPVAEDVPLSPAEGSGRREAYSVLEGASPTRIVTDEDPARNALNGYGGAPQAAEGPKPTAVEPEPVATAEVSNPSTRPAPVVSAAADQPVPSRKPILSVRSPASQNSASSATSSQAEPAPAQAASATVPTAAAAVVGTHVVQVGAFDSQKTALDNFDALSGRLGSLLAGKRPNIQEATVKGRTYHRLRIGPFTSKSEANDYCASLKQRGQDCLVRAL